jgi:hypothetical protein
MIIALCDLNYVLNEENIMLGVYLYNKHNIKEVLANFPTYFFKRYFVINAVLLFNSIFNIC